MSKRKREIQKRKKQAEDTAGEEVVLESQPTVDPDNQGDLTHDEPADDLSRDDSWVDDSQIVEAPRAAAAKKETSSGKKPPEPPTGETVETDSWLGKNKENLLLGLLVLYVLLLGLGTIGELFEIEWILNLPLFK